MNSKRAIKEVHPGWAWLCVVIGLYPVSIAFGVIAVHESKVHAPLWVVALCGIVFIAGGCMILLAQHARLNNLFAGLICLSFAAVGIWVSLFSPSEGFSGGFPFLSSESNIKIARWVFGCGAVLSLVLFGYAVRQIFRRVA